MMVGKKTFPFEMITFQGLCKTSGSVSAVADENPEWRSTMQGNDSIDLLVMNPLPQSSYHTS